MRIFLLAICFGTLWLNVSCENLYEEMASKDADEAILYSARMALSKGDWTQALAEFDKLSAATLAETDVIVDRASAYSGRCGLDFLDLSDLIENIGTARLMDMLLDNFPAVDATNFADCKAAETLLKTAADAQGIVSTERGRFLMAFSSLAKIGVILNHRADADEDIAVDAGWDPCDGNGATDLPQDDVSEIGTGIVLFYKNLQGFSFGADLIAEIDVVCDSVNGAGNDFCDIIDIADMDNTDRQLIRGFIRETDDGIGLGIAAGGATANACEP